MSSRKSKNGRLVFITGATSAIGSELAYQYATHGDNLVLHGRNEVKLIALADKCRTLGVEVETCLLDLADVGLSLKWLEEFLSRRSLDVFIANAGMNINNGRDNSGESLSEMSELLELNVKSTLMLTNLVAKNMRIKGYGQIALISSLAGYYGLPLSPSYSASKAAVKAFGEALRGWLSDSGVGVTVVMPGYVDSAMCREMPGPKPFLWMPDKAARVIRLAIEKNRPRVSFPFPLNLGTWFLAVLPPSVSGYLLKSFGYAGK